MPPNSLTRNNICDVQRLVELELVFAMTLDFKNWQCSMQQEVYLLAIQFLLLISSLSQKMDFVF